MRVSVECCDFRHLLFPLISRIRFMPPLDERMYQALKSAAIAILDPFPVGMHIPVLEAIEEGIPVVSAPLKKK